MKLPGKASEYFVKEIRTFLPKAEHTLRSIGLSDASQLLIEPPVYDGLWLGDWRF